MLLVQSPLLSWNPTRPRKDAPSSFTWPDGLALLQSKKESFVKSGDLSQIDRPRDSSPHFPTTNFSYKQILNAKQLARPPAKKHASCNNPSLHEDAAEHFPTKKETKGNRKNWHGSFTIKCNIDAAMYGIILKYFPWTV